MRLNLSRLAICCGYATVLYLCGLHGSAANAADTDQLSAPNALDTIVVTAEKVERDVNNIGMSVQAISGDSLLRLGVTTPADLQKVVPGFQYNPSPFGNAIYTIRGIGFQDNSLGAGPAVSVYTDEIPLPFSFETRGASLDLARVEVLKGPQGTLYGENSTGGAVNYISAKPTRELDAGLDASYGRFNAVDLQGFLSGPLSDTVQGRVALQSSQSDGWQQSYTRTDTMGAARFYNGRGLLAWQPDSALKFLLSVSGWLDLSQAVAPQSEGYSLLAPLNPPPAGYLNFPLAPANNRAANWNPGADYGQNNTFWSTSLRGDYQAAANTTITSLTAYQKLRRYQPMDMDGTSFDNLNYLEQGKLETLYQELRIGGQFNGLGSWIVGGNYERDSVYDSFFESLADSSDAVVFGSSLATAASFSRQKIRTYAGFANAEYPILKDVTLHAGLRYTQTDRDSQACLLDAGDGLAANTYNIIQGVLRSIYGLSGYKPLGPGDCVSLGPPPTFVPGLATGSLNENNVSWRVDADWKVTPETLVYANVSKGYKAGSFPTLSAALNSQYDPVTQESVLAYEVGFKSTLFDRTLQFNGAAFYYDYSNKQILGDVTDPIFVTLTALVNVPKSHIDGFEFEGTWLPFEGMTIRPGLSYVHSQIDGNFSNFNWQGASQSFEGEPFPFVPKLQANVDAEYGWHLAGAWSAFAGGNVNYQSATNSHFGEYAIWQLPSRSLLDLRAGVENKTWRVSLWGRNVTDKYYWTNAEHPNDSIVRWAGMPATFGVAVNYRFN